MGTEKRSGKSLTLGPIHEGEAVLDIGCGAGVDTIVAAMMDLRRNYPSFPKDCFDVVISNGVFNLLIDKARALKEAFRVLKSRGRLMVADQIMVGELPKGSKESVKKWAG